jgi:hypothetical protein
MRYLKIFAMLVALNTCAWMIPKEVSAQTTASYQTFYDALSPYGDWVNYPNYGYVWIPNVDPGFSPYATAGHWIFTDDGWTWVSDYPWGWAPFHYGRWDYDNNDGWFWIPDNEWSPAWVSWRSSPGYYGWAPLRPGISMSASFGRGYNEPSDRWIFVGDQDFTRSDVSSRYIDRSRNVTIINNSTVIVNIQKDNRRNVSYIAGPNRNDVQKFTHTAVKTVVIQEDSRPGQHLSKGALQIYRPQVQKVSSNGKNPAPAKVMKLNDVKPISKRNVGNQQKNVTPANNNGKQSQNVNSPNNKSKQPQKQTSSNNKSKQPQNVAPTQNKSKQPQNVAPTQNRSKQPQNAAPTQNRSKQSQNVAPTQNRSKQPQNVAPTQNKSKQPQNVAPTQNRSKQPQNVAPTQNKSKQPQNVAPTQNKSKQPQKVAPPKNNPVKQNEKKPDDKK